MGGPSRRPVGRGGGGGQVVAVVVGKRGGGVTGHVTMNLKVAVGGPSPDLFEKGREGAVGSEVREGL
jgi:hypothetical protein